MPFQPRPLNFGDIEYIFIPKERDSHATPFLPPVDFDNPGLDILRTMPKNVTQLNDPFIFYGISKATQTFVPQRAMVLYPENIDFLFKISPIKASIKFLLVHSEIPNLEKLLNNVIQGYPLVFWTYMDAQKLPLKNFEEHFVKDSHEFIERLLYRKADVEKILLEAYPKQQLDFTVNLPLTEYHKHLNTFDYFRGSHSNYWTLNQMIGNHWAAPREKSDDNQALVEHAKTTLSKDKDNLDRYDVLVNQIRNIQELEIIVCDDRKINFPNTKYDYLSPLIVVLPFNYPSLSKVYDGAKSKFIINALSQEQELNYVYYSNTDEVGEPENVHIMASFNSRRTQYLDSLAYLHASFTHSAIMRFPVLGNSIKKYLSFFKPEGLMRSFKTSKELINTFGKKLAKLILPPSRAEKVFGVPNQIVAITDLPIEWLIYRDLNLCLTYDITRIPELPYGGITATYALNSNVQFKVKRDILSRVLVISGARIVPGLDEEMKEYFRAIEKLGVELGFNTAHCKSKQEVIDQVRQHKPDILIFDCHGGFDEDTLSSHLCINDQKLTPSEIAANRITAPIVFLSACHTNPNYGYVNKLADAFFESGCLAITATYFPISVFAGTNLYMRVLHNLQAAVESPIHRTWLEFVSHMVRTSYLKQVIYTCEAELDRKGLPEKPKAYMKKELKKLNLDASLHLLRPNLREKVFKEFNSKLSKIVPRKIFNPDSIVPEHCFYTHMGRGDLIRFECWEEEFYKLNKITPPPEEPA